MGALLFRPADGSGSLSVFGKNFAGRGIAIGHHGPRDVAGWSMVGCSMVLSRLRLTSRLHTPDPETLPDGRWSEGRGVGVVAVRTRVGRRRPMPASAAP